MKILTTRRQRLAEGIYIRAGRITAVASIGTGPTKLSEEQPFYQGTRELDEVIREATAWRLKWKADMLEHGPRRAASGSFAGDVSAFLRSIAEGQSRDEMEALLQHWIDAQLPLSPRGGDRGTFGDAPRDMITRQDILVQLTVWQSEEYAANTLNHRLRAIRRFFTYFADDDAAVLPTDKIAKFRQPEAEQRDIPVALVQQLLDTLPDRGRAGKGETRPEVSETKIRLRVIAWTGLPHMSLERLRARDVDFGGQRMFLRPRRKGQGAAGVWVNLLPPAVEALRDYAAANLWERGFSRDSMRRSWQRAIARLTKQATKDKDQALLEQLRALPPKCHPYDLRHAYASEAYRVTGDLGAVKELLQHADLKTTERYTKGAVSARAAAATAAMAKRWPLPPPRLVPREKANGEPRTSAAGHRPDDGR